MIVNKLGDPEEDGLVSRPRTAQSPETAPSDAVVAREVQQLVHRPFIE
jgi:hypothetical protein